MMDDFNDLSGTHAWRNVERRRVFPRIVTRPDVRVNPSDPAHYEFEGEPCGYGWFPFALRLQSGTILCLYREGVAHVYDRMGRTVASRSTDGGRTWGDPEPILFVKEHTTGPDGICQTGDGAIWVNTRSQYYDGTKGEANDPRAWKTFHTLLRSRDDGRTWKQVPCNETLRGGLEMSNGELLWQGSADDDRGDSVRATIIQREVDGELTWKKRVHPELGPTADEWTVVETATPGVLVVMMRQQQHGHFYATAKSRDYGRTWTPWRESNVYLGPFPTRPMLQRTPDGVLLFTYGQRWIGRTFVVASFDEGETWDTAHRQTILHSPRDYHKIWDSHYTDIARAEGDMWVAVDYIASPSEQSLRGIYGTFIAEKHFRGVYRGAALTATGSTVNPDTVGHWTFDEEDGEFARDAVSDNFGEVHGPKRVRGRIGNALDFDGQDDYVEIFDDATLWVPRYFTLEAWINTRDGSKDQTILSKAPRYTFALVGGKLVLEIGSCRLESEMTEPLPDNQWVHVAVTFGMRRSYSRATFFINGEEHSWTGSVEQFETFAEAIANSDTRVADGPLFQEYGCKNTSTDNLVIGMDNDLKGRPFDGAIDEVAIHRGDLAPDRLRDSCSRAYRIAGEITSLPIVRSPDAPWSTFHAKTTVPEGTSITFRVEDPAGNVLSPDVGDGDDLSALRAEKIVLRAGLATSDPGQTPILHEWSVACQGDATPAHAPDPFPDQAAAHEGKGERPGDATRPGVEF